MREDFLTSHEITLYKNSEELKDIESYGNLYKVIKEFQGKKVGSINQIPQLDKTARDALLNNREMIKELVLREWETIGYSYDHTQHAHCNLCHRDNNKYVFYVRNIKNKTILNVGSVCIDRFPKPKNFNMHEYLVDDDKKQQSFMNNIDIDVFCHYINKFLDAADRYFNLFPILLPYKLYYDMQESIYRMRELFNMDLDLKPVLKEWEKYWNLKCDANTFVHENIRQPLICRRNEIDWMLENNKKDLLDTIAQNNGVYTYDSLKQVYSESIVSDYIKLIIQCNNSPFFKFGKYNSEDIEVIYYKKGYTHQVYFQIKLHDLMKYIGSDCIMIEDYKYHTEDIMKIANIQNIQSNIISIIDYTKEMMCDIDCEFLYDMKKNQLMIREFNSWSIAKIDTANFLNSYQKLITRSDSRIMKELKRIIKSINKWYSIKEQINNGMFKKIKTFYIGIESKR